jgi:3',5'-cyclic AMP phosphodiesterase CpdA
VKRALGAVLLALSLAACSDATADGSSARRPAQPTIDVSVTPAPAASSSPAATTYSFAVIGDFGTGDSVQKSIATRMCKWRKRHPFDVVITTGDNVYPDGDPSRFKSEFVRPYRCLRRHGVEFHASLGNHDAMTDGGDEEVANAKFGMDGHNYVFKAGGVRFVVADSNVLDRVWLRDALTAEDGDRWTVPVFHFPVYSPGTGHGSTPGYRPSLPRMFRKKGVDLVLNGHDHIYSVTKNLRGIRYVVTGGGGAGLYGCSTQGYAATCKAVNHFLYVTAGPKRIEVKAIPASGKPVHSFSTTGRD